MRRRWVWSDELKQLVEIDVNARTRQRAPLIMPDLPDYVSPVSGKLVSGRKQRREDLLRTNSRPWEGRDVEWREAQRRLAYAEQKREERLDRGVREVYYQMPLAHRRAIEGR
jgi:hypothetical protein